MDTFTATKQFVRDIRGPAASILWILMLTGRSLTGEELCGATGYSDKSINTGLEKLTEHRLVQNNGRTNGWSINPQLPFPFLELWQGHHGKFLQDGMNTANAQTERPQAAAYSPDGHKFPLADAGSQDTLPGTAVDLPSSRRSEIPISEIGISDLGDPLVVVDCLVDCLSIDPNNQSTNQPKANGEIGISDLPPLLRRLKISGKAFALLCQQRTDPAQVLAWHWWVSCQPWLNRNPVGYVVARLKEGKPVPGEWLALVEWWQGLDVDGRHIVLSHVSGSDNGLNMHDPATSGDRLAYWLEDDFDELPDTAVLDALIDMCRYAKEELRR